jgi:hypothetical protein
MQAFKGRRLLLPLAVGLVALAIGGVAWASIPSNGGVFTACVTPSSGAVRLIDPSLPKSNKESHCTSAETQVTWNQEGQPGIAGPTGPPGAKGAKGAMGPAGATGATGAPAATLWADVNENGLVQGSGVTSVTVTPNPNYIPIATVTFDRNVSACAYNATEVTNNDGGGGYFVSQTPQDSPDQLDIPLDIPADSSFVETSLVVTC